MDIKRFQEITRTEISQLLVAQKAFQAGEWLRSESEIDALTTDIVRVIQVAIDGSTPWTRRSPYAKPRFTEDCKAAQRRCKQLKRRRNHYGTDEAWEDFRRARNYKHNLIKREQRKAFRRFISEICKSPTKMWKGIRWARDPTPKQTTFQSLTSPITNTEITDPQGKADTLLQTFFPLPVQADLDHLTGREYPPAWQLGPITRDEINRAMQRTPASKAPGSN